ncbi:MAG: phosphatidate cytidylyltransferase [Acidobacteriaceae bacterium]
MLVKRLLVAIVLLPLGLAAIVAGGWFLTALVGLFMGLAAWEYVTLFRAGGYKPARVLVVGGTLLLLVGRNINGFESAPWLISLLILLSMTYHLVAYERGRDQAGTDFGITLGGMLYIGWFGAYFISLRNLPEGKWWILVVLPAVWFADSGAYFIGKRFGRHLLSPRLSPKKTWEGYLGGILVGVALTALFAFLWRSGAGPDSSITPLRGALVGLVMGVFPTLGDLGESMIKRQMGVKDSGNILPGHGGAFDRVDSWLWAVVIGYYMIVWLWG